MISQPRLRPAIGFELPVIHSSIIYFTPSSSTYPFSFSTRIRPTLHEVARKERPHHISHSKIKRRSSLLARLCRQNPLTHQSLQSPSTTTSLTPRTRSHTQCLQPCLHLPNPSQTPPSRTNAAPAPHGLPRANSCSPPRGPGPAPRSMESVFKWRTLGYALSWLACLPEARV